jgi:hypothetical protein
MLAGMPIMVTLMGLMGTVRASVSSSVCIGSVQPLLTGASTLLSLARTTGGTLRCAAAGAVLLLPGMYMLLLPTGLDKIIVRPLVGSTTGLRLLSK